MFIPDPDLVAHTDTAMRSWRQGDLALEERWFVHVGDSTRPLTVGTAHGSDEGVRAVVTGTDGLIVVSQTCDIQRTSRDRPFVEVAPLMRVEVEAFRSVTRGRRPRHVTLPCLEPGFLVADLDRIQTVEKAVVAPWKRTPGCTSDADRRRLEHALVRKRARVAFPDDFTAMVKKLLKRFEDKHDRATEEGRALRALREIRVHAQPSWDAPRVDVKLWFIRGSEDATFEGRDWSTLLNAWNALVAPSGRFRSVHAKVVPLSLMSAEEYVSSDILDLDHLSL